MIYEIRHVFNFNIYNGMPQAAATRACVENRTQLNLADITENDHEQRREQRVARHATPLEADHDEHHPLQLSQADAPLSHTKPCVKDSAAPPKPAKRQGTSLDAEPSPKRTHTTKQSAPNNRESKTSSPST